MYGDPPLTLTTTPYGFVWGPSEVTRMMSHDGGVVLEVASEKHKVQIWVSPRGRSVRVWKDHEELHGS